MTDRRPLIRRHALLAGAAMLTGCTTAAAPYGPAVTAPAIATDGFTVRDGAILPYRAWHPDSAPRAVVLALHGFNDSRDAWDIPAPAFADAGIALYAPDQRGFGAAPGRCLWAGGEAMADDAADMAAALRARHPGVPFYMMGESMGGAVLMVLATRPAAPEVSGYILLAPAVWGRARMNPFVQASLWLASTLVPGMTVPSRPPPGMAVHPTDNIEALRQLSRNPLTIKETRFDTLRGLVDLMDAALAAAPEFAARSLFLYGAHDDLVPPPATRATWRALPPGPTRALYEHGYHLLLRDLGRARPLADILAWIANPLAPLPSDAETRAATWLASAS